MGFIYKIVNVVSEDFYIGSAVKEKRRKWEHWTLLKTGRHHCARLQNAWNEYGEDAFEFVLVEQVDDDQLITVEDIYLQMHAGQAHCYNTALSTKISPAVQKDIRQKISTTLKTTYGGRPENHPRYGKAHSEETKALISAKKKANPTKYWLGKARDEATKAKISDAQRGVPKTPRVFTPEGLERARENMRRNAKVPARLEFATVYAKFPEGVKERYDFSGAVYTGAMQRITGLRCPIHGEFSQYAAQIRKGRACPRCGADIRAGKKHEEMLEKWGIPEEREKMLAARKSKKQEKIDTLPNP